MRDWNLYLEDMRTAVGRILEYSAGMTREQFFADQKTCDAVIRNLEIIGEAAGRLPEEIRQEYPGINFARIRGMRNILAHAYFGIDEDILWDVVTNHVPALHEKLG